LFEPGEEIGRDAMGVNVDNHGTTVPGPTKRPQSIAGSFLGV